MLISARPLSVPINNSLSYLNISYMKFDGKLLSESSL